jgi:hypothetical protein
MNKERQRADRIQKAVEAQRRFFSGAPGSAKERAHTLLRSLSKYAVINGKSCISKELLEYSREDMLKELQTCDSDLFRQITEIATAFFKRDSRFFKKIADGLEQLPSSSVFHMLPLEELEPMQFLHRAYMSWTFPTDQKWLSIWTIPYTQYVEQGIEPTKEQLRKLTERFWAVERLIKRNRIELCFATEQQPPQIEELIAKEIKGLPEQNWARKWKQAGLSHLKSGLPGPKSTKKRSVTKKVRTLH